MSAKMSTNLITGLFLTVSLMAFAGLMVYLQGVEPEVQGDPFVVIFDSAPDVRKNTQVKVAGKPVGEVEEVVLRQVKGDDGNTITRNYISIRLDPLKLGDEVRVFDDASASIEIDLFRGPSIVLDTGVSGSLLQPGSEIQGATPTGMTQVMESANSLTVDVAGALEDVRGLIQRIEKDYAENSPMGAIKSVAERTDKLVVRVDESMGKVDTVLESIGTATRQVAPAIEDARKLIEELSGVGQQVSKAIESLGPVIEEAGPTARDVRELIASLKATIDENRVQLDATLKNLNAVSASASDLIENRIATSLDEFDKMAASIGGAAERMDEMLAANSGDIRQMVVSLRETGDEMQQLVAKLRRDPSIAVWGPDEADNSADRNQPEKNRPSNDRELRESGRLGARERSSE